MFYLSGRILIPHFRAQLPKYISISQYLNIFLKFHCILHILNFPYNKHNARRQLLFTNSPSQINRVKRMPPIGKADHYIVYIEYDFKAKRIQQAPRKIFLYKRADMDGLHDHLSTDHSDVSVNDMWVSFKSEVLSAIERFIPTKMTKTKYSLPWIDSSIKRLIRKRDKLYFRAHKSSSPDIKNHYKRFRAHVQALELHIGSMLPISSPLKMITLIPIVPGKMKRQKILVICQVP